MKSIIRNLALGLSLSLPSLAIAQGTYLSDPANPANHVLAIAPGGNLGIGTQTAGWPLHLSKAGTNSGALCALLSPNMPNAGMAQIYMGRQTGSDQCGTLTYTYAEAAPQESLLSLGLYGSSYTVNLAGNGNVGIGTRTPGVKLHVAVAARNNDGVITTDAEGRFIMMSPSFGQGAYNSIVQPGDQGMIFTRSTMNSEGAFVIAPWASTLSGLRMTAQGNVGIGTATPLAKLDVNGTTRTKALELTGGADIAEMFQSVELLEPGTVVVADEAHEGQVRAAVTACDESAIGIVSGAGGIQPAQTLRQEGTLADGNIPVSTGGRVWCKCDASFGAIKPGTLLTTSATPGHAMKVTDKARAQGAIIGKALTSLKEGQGLVLVWVTHQ